MSRLRCLLGWLVLVCGACSGRSTPTQLLVIVDSNIEYGALGPNDLAQIEIQLRSADGARRLGEAVTVELRSTNDRNAAELPLSFALTPEGDDQESLFRLVITGKNRDGLTVVAQQVFTAFRQGEARVLDVVLHLRCFSVVCHGDPLPGDLTCSDGVCQEIPTRTDLAALEGDGLSTYESPFADLHEQRWADAGAVSPPNLPEGGLDAGVRAPDAGFESGLDGPDSAPDSAADVDADGEVPPDAAGM